MRGLASKLDRATQWVFTAVTLMWFFTSFSLIWWAKRSYYMIDWVNRPHPHLLCDLTFGLYGAWAPGVVVPGLLDKSHVLEHAKWLPSTFVVLAGTALFWSVLVTTAFVSVRRLYDRRTGLLTMGLPGESTIAVFAVLAALLFIVSEPAWWVRWLSSNYISACCLRMDDVQVPGYGLAVIFHEASQPGWRATEYVTNTTYPAYDAFAMLEISAINAVLWATIITVAFVLIRRWRGRRVRPPVR